MLWLHDVVKVLSVAVILVGCASEVGLEGVGPVDATRGGGRVLWEVSITPTVLQSVSSAPSLLADTCADASGPGVYKGYTCEGANNFIIAEGISCQDARRKCHLNAEANPSLSFYCTWNDRVVYRKDISAGACDSLVCQTTSGTGQRVVNFCYSSTDIAPVIITDGVSCQFALDNCKHNADLNPHRSVLCTWRGLEIFRRELAVGSCGGPSSM